MDDPQYYNAVIDTAKLVDFWSKAQQEVDIFDVVKSIETSIALQLNSLSEKKINSLIDSIDNPAAQTSSPARLSPADVSPEPYWAGVNDTIHLIYNFLHWKQTTRSSRTISNLLVEVLDKAQRKKRSLPSPLLGTLGISFEEEVNDLPDELPQSFDEISQEMQELQPPPNEEENELITDTIAEALRMLRGE